MIIWGGENNAGTVFFADGARYNLATDIWTRISAPPSGFAGRYGNAAVWTGSKLLIWGGQGAAGALADGAAYDPASDSWTLFSASPLSARFPAYGFSTTTSELIVWGSAGELSLNDGAVYRPLGNLWGTMPASPLAPRGAVAFSWTGTQFMIFGGASGTSFMNDGARYNPVSLTWTPLDAPPLGYVSRVWFGQSVVNGGLILVGGLTAGFTPVADGIAYDASGAAQLVPAIPSSVLTTPERQYFQAWCDGVDRCWFWSGVQISGSSSAVFPGGAVYSLSSKTWSSMTTVGEPSPRAQAMTVWTGKSALVWSGANTSTELTDGAVFTP